VTALRYALFAAIATACNLAAQHVVLAATASLAAAMAVGTGTGLVTKYLLDRHWIFFDRDPAMVRQFSLYSLTGVLTTLLFWGTELAFAASFDSALMRDLGAVLGLAVGYWAKYRLDRRFVFQ
jgi:putative flippase GtrA